MSFTSEIKDKALAATGRCCSICHKFCGLKMELHHIVHKSEGGEDTFENCIPLCFDCHGDMRSYDHNHPKGTKYSKNELREHRNAWYRKVQQSPSQNYSEASANLDKALYYRIKELLPLNQAIRFARDGRIVCGSFPRSILDELDRFLDACNDPAFEFIDADLEALRSKLESDIDRFTNLAATNTWAFEKDLTRQIIPPEWKSEQPELLRKIAAEFVANGEEIGKTYDEIVRQVRRKLGIQ